MGAITDLKNGILQLLADQGVITYRTDGSAYLPTEIAGAKSIMPDQPDQCVVVNVIPTNENITIPEGTPIVQIAMRGLPDDSDSVDDLSDAVFNVLQALTNVPMGSVTVMQMYRSSSVPMGQDDSFRIELADHYTVDLWYPPTNNRH